MLIVGLIGLVLVVACLNLANLMLARGTGRQREFAVRRALGASRWRLVRELCIESSIVAVLGGALGLLLIRAILGFAYDRHSPTWRRPCSIEPRLDGAGRCAAAGTALLLSLLVFGVEPAFQLTRGVGARRSVRRRHRRRRAASGRQRAFIRWQVAISATFLLIAAILAKVVVGELRHDSGVDLRSALGCASSLSRASGTPSGRGACCSAVVERTCAGSGTLESVAISSSVPFGITG